jgi:hypothetical protein
MGRAAPTLVLLGQQRLQAVGLDVFLLIHRFFFFFGWIQQTWNFLVRRQGNAGQPSSIPYPSQKQTKNELASSAKR